jgi:hypothetical protein
LALSRPASKALPLAGAVVTLAGINPPCRGPRRILDMLKQLVSKKVVRLPST